MSNYRAHVLVCCGTGCTSSNSHIIMENFSKFVAEKGLEKEIDVVKTGCFGLCAEGPIVVIYPEGTMYYRCTPEDVEEIVNEHLVKGRKVERLLKTGNPDSNPTDFYSKQMRIALRNCGRINPDKIEEYIAHDGYQALCKILSTKRDPAEIISEIKESGLRGRGGGGFPTGMKWDFAAKVQNDTKYVCCNADEGDPGAFMDRSVLEGDPHRVLEGMAVCGYAMGASEGYIYCRAEYPLAIKRLNIAIKQAMDMGLLGDKIFGTDFSFHIKVKEGAGAFVCGEETALLASIEGKRGMPRPRPPFPAVSGLWGKPTNINNVETFANVPNIIVDGAAAYAAVGTEKSKGTKVFALTGKINNTGLAEVPMGITMREIIYEIGGGIPDGKKFKAVQIGGPSGGCLPEEMLDLKIDYESLTAAGAMIAGASRGACAIAGQWTPSACATSTAYGHRPAITPPSAA